MDLPYTTALQIKQKAEKLIEKAKRALR